MNRLEKLIYYRVIRLAMAKLARYNRHLAPETLEQRSVLNDFVIVKMTPEWLKIHAQAVPAIL